MKILRHFRPSGMLTALANTWAGFAISGAILFSFIDYQFHFEFNIEIYKLLLLSIGGILLYLGGTSLSGYFRNNIIPSKTEELSLEKLELSRVISLTLGLGMLSIAIVLDFFVGKTSGGISLLIAFLTIFNQVYGRHHAMIEPLIIGLCRAGLLLLGVSLVPHKIGYDFMVIFIPLVFFAGNIILRHSKETKMYRKAIQLAGWMYFLVICYILAVALINNKFLITLPFTLLLFYIIFRPVTVAFREPLPENIKKAFQWTYLATILIDSAIACSYSGLVPALIILCLFPVAWLFSKAESGNKSYQQLAINKP